ncbi:Histone deacetylase complex subunit SAP18 [Heracleum sosnowskyi]|uniref:Histone deacetylase complex subunit SAP18 n=1 Tax=Heracleum sosnowskyi TaxID=360622 RepID=A0AAD8MM24_9APIA|nr:Histone deacetylase complex subunit SAP18 [Heracleum sosnowskyi]KAK1377028.1 Histone deacetylase complex subunit SAP18 [Heracleum sosnowskyi]
MELGQRRGGRAFNPGRVQPGPPFHSRPAKPFHHQPIDREKTCPLLLRVFTKVGAHHTEDEFSVRGKEPKDEVQIYTWKDATLRELTDLVKEVAPEANKKDATLSFAFVYPCKTGRLLVRKVGRTFSHPDPRRPDNGNMSLRDFDFEIGDYLDVAIL